MQVHPQKFSCKHLSKHDRIVLTNEIYVFEHEAAMLLLGQFLGPKFLAINKLNLGIDGLVLGLSVVWNVLAGDEQNLERIQLFVQIVRQQRSLTLDLQIQVVQLMRFEYFVK